MILQPSQATPPTKKGIPIETPLVAGLADTRNTITELIIHKKMKFVNLST